MRRIFDRPKFFKQGRIQKVKTEAIFQIDGHISGKSHFRFPSPRSGRLEFIEAPERITVRDRQPEIPERKLDVAAKEKKHRLGSTETA